MRLRHALTSAGIGAALIVGVGVTASPASATPRGCWSEPTNPTFARGACSDMSDGGIWRLGIRCSDGDYKWSSWKRDTRPTSLRCTGGTVITHDWIDAKNETR